MPAQRSIAIAAKSGRQQFREAILAAFSETAESIHSGLANYDERAWQRNYPWLDSSGLALYLLDRLITLGCEDALPPAVLARLRQNLTDNRARTEALFAELMTINQRFHHAGMPFVNLKGVSLWPISVPDPALRCQMDLDFLILEEHAATAQHLLESMGYRPYVKSGNTWEFRAGTSSTASREDLYKPKPQRTVDLHLADAGDGRLNRSQVRIFEDEPLPVLAPVDLFLAQAFHLFHHIAGAFTRAAWALEYRRHMLARGDDAAFWEAVESRGNQRPQDALAVGIATLLTRESFDDCVPAALSRWTVDRLPPPVELWVKLYGRRVLLADFPGTKLYLLLQQELHAEEPQQTAAIRRHYFPLHLPPMITHGQPGEQLAPRLRRYRAQMRFVLFRLRFHLLENIRYTLEQSRWRRRRGFCH